MSYTPPLQPFVDNAAPVGGGDGQPLNASFFTALVAGVKDADTRLTGLEAKKIGTIAGASDFVGTGAVVGDLLSVTQTAAGGPTQFGLTHSVAVARALGWFVVTDPQYAGGAVGDGVADDFNAVNTAVAAARNAFGGTVFFPAGTYKLGQTLVAQHSANQNPLRLVGDGSFGSVFIRKGAIITRPAGTTHTMLTAIGQGLILENLTLDGQGTAGRLLEINRGFELRLLHVRCYNAKNYGLYARALSNAEIDTLHVDLCGASTTKTDAAITAGSTTLTSASGVFAATDIGMIATIGGAGAAGAALVATITAVTDAATVTLSQAAGATVSAATMTYGASGVRIAGSPTYEANSNTVYMKNIHLERGRGVDLDLAYGTDAADISEFILINGLHIEAAIDNTDMVAFKTDPCLRIGNCGGVEVSNFFLYGGGGPLIYSERLLNPATSPTTGATFVAGYLFGHTSAGATTAGTPARLVDLKSGDGFAMFGVTFDTALTEMMRVQSTYGANVAIRAAYLQPARSGASSTLLNDQRTDANRAVEFFQGGAELRGDWTAKATTAVPRIATIDTLAGQLGVQRWSTAGVARWDLRKVASESGTGDGSNLELVGRNDAGGALGPWVTFLRANGTRFENRPLGFYGTTPIPKQTGTPAAATDPATTMALVNDLRAKLIALGLFS